MTAIGLRPSFVGRGGRARKTDAGGSSAWVRPPVRVGAAALARNLRREQRRRRSSCTELLTLRHPVNEAAETVPAIEGIMPRARRGVKELKPGEPTRAWWRAHELFRVRIAL